MEEFKNNFTDKIPSSIPSNATFVDSDTDKVYKWDGKKWIQVYPDEKKKGHKLGRQKE